MKHKRLIMVLLLIPIFCGLLLAGGASEKAAEKEEIPKTLSIAHMLDPTDTKNKRSVALVQIVDEFTRKTGIKVEIETIPYDRLESKLIITNQAGNPVDLSWISSQKMASILNTGALRPLDDLIERDYTKDELEDFLETEKKTTISLLDGKKYGFMESIHSRLLWYNKELVPVPPKNWAEVIEIGKKISDPEKGIYGFGFYGSKHYGSVEVALAPMIWSAGGQISNPDGTLAFNSPEVMEAIKFYSDTVDVHKIAPSSVFTAPFGEVRVMFHSGNIGMIIDGTYRKPKLEVLEFAKKGNLGWAPIPGKNGPAPNFANGYVLAIPSKSKNVEGAWEFIKHFETPEMQIINAQAAGSAPTRKSALKDPAFSKEMFQFFYKNLEENGRPMDPLVFYQEGLETLNLAALTYWLDPTVDLEKILDDEVTAFNKKYYNK